MWQAAGCMIWLRVQECVEPMGKSRSARYRVRPGEFVNPARPTGEPEPPPAAWLHRFAETPERLVGAVSRGRCDEALGLCAVGPEEPGLTATRTRRLSEAPSDRGRARV